MGTYNAEDNRFSYLKGYCITMHTNKLWASCFLKGFLD